jgi:putative membrane protein
LSTETLPIVENNLPAAIVALGASLSVALLPEPVLAQTTFSDCEGYMWHGGWVFGPIVMVLFLALIVAAIVFIVRWLTRSEARQSASRPDAVAILQERFARGEIDKDEYDDRRKILRQP